MRYIKNCDGEHCDECVNCTNLIDVKNYHAQINNGKVVVDIVKGFANGNPATVIDLNGDTFKEIIGK